MRLARITLATKYRILFGLAVLLIIGAALAVPWYYMEVLVLEPPFREAQSIADSYFRLALSQPHAAGRPVGGAHGGKFSLLHEPSGREPAFIPFEPNLETATSEPAQSNADPFVKEAFRTFRKRPNKEFYYQTAWGDNGRRFQYAHAVWINRGCLNCHEEGRSARPYRENQLAGVITVDLPAEPGGQSSLVNRVVIVAAGASNVAECLDG